MKKALFRWISLPLSVILFSTQVAFAHMPQTTLWEERRNATESIAPSNAKNLALPHVPLKAASSTPAVIAEFATVRHIQTSPKPKAPVVILVQDIHGQAEAQKNLGRLILSLLEKDSQTPVGLEGASGPIPFAQLRDKSAFINSEVGSYFFNAGIITGAEYAGFLAKETPHFVGLENKTLYQENIAAVKAALSKQKTELAEIEKTEMALGKEKAAAYSEPMQTLDGQTQKYHNGTLGMVDYLTTLSKIKNTTDYATITLFQEASKLENSLNFNLAERERSKFLSKLVQELTPSQIKELTQRTELLRSGEVTYPDYFRYLKTLSATALNTTPEFKRYINYVLQADAINAEKLLTELSTFEKEIWASLCTSSKQRELAEASRFLRLQEKLVRLTMTPEEWAEYRKFTIGDLRLTIEPKYLNPFEQFYSLAEKRDVVLANNFLKEINSNRKSSIVNRKYSVLVAGGFHSKEIMKLLAKENITVMTVSPKLTTAGNINSNDYLNLFTREKTPLDKLFAAPKISLIEPLATGAPETIDVVQKLKQLFNETRAKGVARQQSQLQDGGSGIFVATRQDLVATKDQTPLPFEKLTQTDNGTLVKSWREQTPEEIRNAVKREWWFSLPILLPMALTLFLAPHFQQTLIGLNTAGIWAAGAGALGLLATLPIYKWWHKQSHNTEDWQKIKPTLIQFAMEAAFLLLIIFYVPQNKFSHGYQHYDIAVGLAAIVAFISAFIFYLARHDRRDKHVAENVQHGDFSTPPLSGGKLPRKSSPLTNQVKANESDLPKIIRDPLIDAVRRFMVTLQKYDGDNINQWIVDNIQLVYPTHYLLTRGKLSPASETINEQNKKSDYVWVISTDDGISIALFYKGRPVFATMASHLFGGILEAYQGREGAYKNGGDLTFADDSIHGLGEFRALVPGNSSEALALREFLSTEVKKQLGSESLQMDPHPSPVAVALYQFLRGEFDFTAFIEPNRFQGLWDFAAASYILAKVGAPVFIYKNGDLKPALTMIEQDITDENARRNDYLLFAGVYAAIAPVRKYLEMVSFRQAILNLDLSKPFDIEVLYALRDALTNDNARMRIGGFVASSDGKNFLTWGDKLEKLNWPLEDGHLGLIQDIDLFNTLKELANIPEALQYIQDVSMHITVEMIGGKLQLNQEYEVKKADLIAREMAYLSAVHIMHNAGRYNTFRELNLIGFTHRIRSKMAESYLNDAEKENLLGILEGIETAVGRVTIVSTDFDTSSIHSDLLHLNKWLEMFSEDFMMSEEDEGNMMEAANYKEIAESIIAQSKEEVPFTTDPLVEQAFIIIVEAFLSTQFDLPDEAPKKDPDDIWLGLLHGHTDEPGLLSFRDQVLHASDHGGPKNGSLFPHLLEKAPPTVPFMSALVSIMIAKTGGATLEQLNKHIDELTEQQELTDAEKSTLELLASQKTDEKPRLGATSTGDWKGIALESLYFIAAALLLMAYFYAPNTSYTFVAGTRAFVAVMGTVFIGLLLAGQFVNRHKGVIRSHPEHFMKKINGENLPDNEAIASYEFYLAVKFVEFFLIAVTPLIIVSVASVFWPQIFFQPWVGWTAFGVGQLASFLDHFHNNNTESRLWNGVLGASTASDGTNGGRREFLKKAWAMITSSHPLLKAISAPTQIDPNQPLIIRPAVKLAMSKFKFSTPLVAAREETIFELLLRATGGNTLSADWETISTHITTFVRETGRITNGIGEEFIKRFKNSAAPAMPQIPSKSLPLNAVDASVKTLELAQGPLQKGLIQLGLSFKPFEEETGAINAFHVDVLLDPKLKGTLERQKTFEHLLNRASHAPMNNIKDFHDTLVVRGNARTEEEVRLQIGAIVREEMPATLKGPESIAAAANIVVYLSMVKIIIEPEGDISPQHVMSQLGFSANGNIRLDFYTATPKEVNWKDGWANFILFEMNTGLMVTPVLLRIGGQIVTSTQA